MTIVPRSHNRSNELFLKALVYGNPGVGKTTFASGAVDIGGVLFLEMEGGMLSVPTSDKIQIIDVKDAEKPLDAFEEVLWALARRDYKENPWLEPIRTIVMDSGSEFYKLALEQIVKEAMKINTKHTIDDIWIEDYGQATTKLTRLFRMMRDLPYNIIMTSLAKFTYPPPPKGERTNTIVRESMTDPIDVRPDLTAKLCNSTMGFFDHVWYAYSVEANEDEKKTGRDKNVIFMTKPAGVYVAKTRGTAFPAKIGSRMKNPTFTSVYNTLLETESATPKKQPTTNK